MKVLQLSPRFPFPPDDGGKIGMANITKHLSRLGADITLFSFIEPGNYPGEKAFEEASEYCSPIFLEHSTKNSLFKIAKSIITNRSIYLDKHINNFISDYLESVFRSVEFDIIHIDHSAMGPLGAKLKKKFDVTAGLRLHNIEYMIWERYAESLASHSIKKRYVKKQAELLKKEESRLYSEVDTCFAITEPDRKKALEISPNANVKIASAGVNPDEWQPENVERNEYELILATQYNWIHNIDALKWFLANVFPKIKAEFTGARLTLIGKNAPEWLNNYKKAGVNPVGYVDSVQPYLNKAAVYIAPLFVGGGIRIKILEAMAMELPVVATPVSAEGIPAGGKDGLIIVGNADEFSDAVNGLFRNPEKARALGKSAREFILKNFTWEKNVSIMMDTYEELLKKESK